MYSATGKDVLFLIFLFLQKRTCHTIYHHSMSQQALVYLKQVLWNLSSILFLVYKIKFYSVKYCGLGNTVNRSCLFLSHGTTQSHRNDSCACTNQQQSLKLGPQLSKTDWDCFQFGLFYFYICRGPYKQHKLERDNKVML